MHPAATAETIDEQYMRLTKAIAEQIIPCWDGVDDLPYARQFKIQLQLKLSAAGSIDGPINVVVPETIDAEHPETITAITRAKRAVTTCTPIDLPENTLPWPMPMNINLGPVPEPEAMG